MLCQNTLKFLLPEHDPGLNSPKCSCKLGFRVERRHVYLILLYNQRVCSIITDTGNALVKLLCYMTLTIADQPSLPQRLTYLVTVSQQKYDGMASLKS